MPGDINVRNLRIVDTSTGRPLVNGIDFSVSKGEVLAIVGESGSGKSISCMSLVGLLASNLDFSADTMEVDGENLLDKAGRREAFRRIRGRKVAVIFQDPMSALDPLARVGSQLVDIVSFNQKIGRKEAYGLVLDALRRVQIRNCEQVMSLFPFQLSGGMLQRASIALAIACKPDYIIADEPTTALDPSVQKDILDLLMQLKESLGIGFIFITHDFGVVRYVADTICVMQDGTVVETGGAQAVLRAPQHAYTRKLLDAVPRFGEGAGDAAGGMAPGTSADVPAGTSINNPANMPAGAQPVSGRTDDGVLTLDNVTFGYKKAGARIHPDHMVLRDINLAVRKGESLGIVGESGSGKSTLMKLALGIHAPLAGTIALEGKDVGGYSRIEFSRKVQPVFQNPGTALNPAKKVIDAVVAPLLAQGQDKRESYRKARETLDAVGILERFDQAYVTTLSGGQKQRVAIARAIVSRPRILLCDEPTSALDVSVQAQVIELLKSLKRHFDLTMVFISHNLGVVSEICDSLAVIEHGRIVEHGNTGEIFSNPRHGYTKKLIDSLLI